MLNECSSKFRMKFKFLRKNSFMDCSLRDDLSLLGINLQREGDKKGSRMTRN